MINAPVSCLQVKQWTGRDKVLAEVTHYINTGWPQACPVSEVMKPYWMKRNKLSVLQGCIVWGSRVVMPLQGRQLILNDWHQGHQGMVGMKSCAKSMVW